MRVLHLATFLQGGAGRCIVDLATAQRAAGLDVTVVTTATPVDDYGNYPEYLAELQRADVRLLMADSLFARDRARNLDVVTALSSRWRAGLGDIIHAHAATPALIGLIVAGASRHPVPVVQTMHGWGVRKTATQAAEDLSVLSLVSSVVTTSMASRDLMAAMGLAVDAMRVIPCGIDAAAPAAPDDDVAGVLRAERARGSRVLLCIGSITPAKNQAQLVEALATLRQRTPVFCGFIGEGAGAEALSSRAAALGIADGVRFFGYRPAASAYLALADALVLPSLSEGQGLAAVEACRAEVLTIASDIPAFSEIVPEPDRGVSFEAGSVESLIAAVERSLSLTAKDRAARTARARAHFARRYTRAAMVAAHDALYASLGRPVTLRP